LAEQVKILMEEALENNLADKAFTERWRRWSNCSMCEQPYHGVVACALGWACWKTYVGRPEGKVGNYFRGLAMSLLGTGLDAAGLHEDALRVREAELSMLRRFGASEHDFLISQGNLATAYFRLGQFEQALSIERDVYSGKIRLYGEEHRNTLLEASNFADSLCRLQRFEEARSVMRKMMPVARRVLGDSHLTTFTLRSNYARALYDDPGATLDDLREAVSTLEELAPIARRVLGSLQPTTRNIERQLQHARVVLRARETQSSARP
jgi:tetratricopeptide (TPR) repeat protein